MTIKLGKEKEQSQTQTSKARKLASKGFILYDSSVMPVTERQSMDIVNSWLVARCLGWVSRTQNNFRVVKYFYDTLKEDACLLTFFQTHLMAYTVPSSHHRVAVDVTCPHKFLYCHESAALLKLAQCYGGNVCVRGGERSGTFLCMLLKLLVR